MPKAGIEKVCKSIIALFGDIDKAADDGKKADTIKVFDRYKAKVKELKKHGEHEKDD